MTVLWLRGEDQAGLARLPILPKTYPDIPRILLRGFLSAGGLTYRGQEQEGAKGKQQCSRGVVAAAALHLTLQIKAAASLDSRGGDTIGG